MPNIIPADSKSVFNFTFNASSLIGASAHDFNDFNPSQQPGAMLYTAYQYLSVDPTPSASSSTRIVHPSHYTQSHHLLPALSSESSSESNSSNLTSTLDPTTKEHLLMEATGAAFLILYQYNKLEVQVNDSKVWELHCPHGCWIKSGIRSHVKLLSRG
ncbi:hypothetical protein DFH29DRAFT_881363 [Suillus ampliporus]|nr:hypothetical protein DFH29DRAFT_881363 [Suillus ampliporus]